MFPAVKPGPIKGRNYTVTSGSFTFFGQQGYIVTDEEWRLIDGNGEPIWGEPHPILADIEAELVRVIDEGKENLIARVCLSPVDGLRLALEGILDTRILMQSNETADSIGFWLPIVGRTLYVVIQEQPPCENTPAILNPNGQAL